MDKKKVLHALRSLEMTLEQKQEFIDAIAESDNTGSKDVVIDITPITVNEEDHMELTDNEINAIKNNSFKFIDIYESIIHNYYIWTIQTHNDSINITSQYSHDGVLNKFVVNLNSKWLLRDDAQPN